ncbi:MAG: ORF6N domain-containing protein [Cryomorphaceae bacterium]|nr:ORF6N domain-containing protein [Cryomorphaceae bacterium]
MNKNLIIPQERILNRIVVIRDEKVMLDVHLAELYEVETRTLKQAVRRNLDLFPEDFMFELTEPEIEIVVSQNVIPTKQHLGGAKPFAFTETGVAMLSSVLKSKRAKEMNVAIMRTFVALRKLALGYAEIMGELEEIRNRVVGHDDQINLIFEYLKQFEQSKKQSIEHQKREKIGFKIKKRSE